MNQNSIPNIQKLVDVDVYSKQFFGVEKNNFQRKKYLLESFSKD